MLRTRFLYQGLRQSDPLTTPQENPNMSRTDIVVDQMLQDEDWLRRFLRETTQNAAYLIAKREWDMEDNFETTEKLKGLMEEQIPEENIVEIYSEGDYDIDLDDIEEHLQQYHPDTDDADDADDKDL